MGTEASIMALFLPHSITMRPRHRDCLTTMTIDRGHGRHAQLTKMKLSLTKL
jgi:hypothetical protein